MGRDSNNTVALMASMTTEPAFGLTFYGYRRRDVDSYAQLMEAHLAEVAAERQELQSRIRALSDQLQEAHVELVELHRRPAADDLLSFRHLGPRIEQILAQAEEQADVIRLSAVGAVDDERAAAASLRAEEERAIARRREELDAEINEAKSYGRRVRAEADTELAVAREEARRVVVAAHDESKRIVAAAATTVDSQREAGSAQTQAIREKADKTAAIVAANAEAYARQTRQAAEQHARETRAAAEQHAQQTRAAAELAATEVRSQAEQQAAQMRSTAAKLHTAAPGSPAAPKHAATQPDPAGENAAKSEAPTPDPVGAAAAVDSTVEAAGPASRADGNTRLEGRRTHLHKAAAAHNGEPAVDA